MINLPARNKRAVANAPMIHLSIDSCISSTLKITAKSKVIYYELKHVIEN